MTHRPIAGRLVIATHNPGKLAEMRDLLALYGVDAISAGELGLPEPEETGLTFEENAILKAIAAATASGHPSLADDSGIVVDALGGEPGIYSARWAGPNKDFAAAMRRIEDELKKAGALTPDKRTARFVAVLCLAFPDGRSEIFRGEVEGTLVWPPRGANGFGYDSMFLPSGKNLTFGEMEPAAKHAISHRAAAFRQLTGACFGR